MLKQPFQGGAFVRTQIGGWLTTVNAIEIGYWVEPSFSDGYSVHVTLDERPLISTTPARLKFPADTETPPYPRREELPLPPKYLSPIELQTLRRVCETVRVPIAVPHAQGEVDGVLHRLYVRTVGFEVLLVWGTVLPACILDLVPLLRVLEDHAMQA